MGLRGWSKGVGRRLIAVLGRPWVFWPALLFSGVFNRGPDRFGSAWAWLVILAVVGPLLSLVIYTASQRKRPREGTSSAWTRVLEHFRGPAATTG